MTGLGNGLGLAGHNEDALTVKEAELATLRRLGGSERNMLVVQSNLADTHAKLGRKEEALRLRRDVYSGYLKLLGEEDEDTLIAAINYVASLGELERFGEAKSLLRKIMPVAPHVLGESHETTLRMRQSYAAALYNDPGATLEDLREAVTTFEDIGRIARRVLGGTHPYFLGIEKSLRIARAALRARDSGAA